MHRYSLFTSNRMICRSALTRIGSIRIDAFNDTADLTGREKSPSMRQSSARKNQFAFMILSSACLLTGCAEAPRTAATAKAQELGGVGTAVTFLDRRQLQVETGKIDADAPVDFQTTDSGLQYRILRKSGWQKPTVHDKVTVHYRGWLDDGRVFDSSYSGDTPDEFKLNKVVAGWTEGLQLIGIGGMIELWIPAHLGYGAQGQGPAIPPNAPLHFIVELLSIN